MYKVRRDIFQGRYVISHYSKDEKDLYWEMFNVEWEDVLNFIKNTTVVVKLFSDETKQ
jgi:hypothetical protein